jgi:transmembrane sensor
MKKWIPKILLTKQNAEEKEALEAWHGQMTANIKGMNDAIQTQNAINHLRGYEVVDQNAAWKKIAARTQPVLAKPSGMGMLYKVAAVLLCVIAAWFVFDRFTSSEGVSPQSYVYEVNKQLILEDNSVIDLESSSILTELGNRKTQLSGRAFFNIAKDPSHPFEVKVHHGLVTVLGTAFDIITNDDFTHIHVTEGRVKFTRNAETIILSVGDMVTIDATGVTKGHREQVQVNAWQNKKLVFNNESLVNVLYSVASYHQKQLKFVNTTQSNEDNCKINSTYTTESLTEILKELSIIAGLKFNIEKNTIVVQSFKC